MNHYFPKMIKDYLCWRIGPRLDAKRFGFLIAVVAIMVLLGILSQPAAAATECTDLPSGSVASIAGRIVSNDGQILMCENGSWVPFIKYNTNGDVTSLGNSTCTADQVLKFDGTKFICADDNTGGGGGGGGCAPACKADMSNIQIGDTCDDGSQFLGSHLTFAWQGFYVTDTNQSSSSNWSNAITLCNNLNRHGHTDWYLPSKDELNHLYANRNDIGGYTTSDYWSSTEVDSANAYSQLFSSGAQYGKGKSSTYDVRCVRRG